MNYFLTLTPRGFVNHNLQVISTFMRRLLPYKANTPPSNVFNQQRTYLTIPDHSHKYLFIPLFFSWAGEFMFYRYTDKHRASSWTDKSQTQYLGFKP